ncbi:GNAT family N-acetyltransferase [Ramlibacter sp. WS9]|uniref:GNAT family N-acetyltransferase n=1 Tax=Ramlibacter sp. WS9 TaxID=1882741 RepID=UPI001142E74C|nr:GNAT family N-acetyltransferase [Ramlibacter sp. WS9]
MPQYRETDVAFENARAEDAEALAALRVAAMRESLERIGRFDPVRARERFLGGFAPEHTRHIVVAGERVGFVVVKPIEDGVLLDHLYIAPAFQRRGIGAVVLAGVFAQADAQAKPLRVGALRGSDSNRFYQRHGFELVETSEWDNYYARACRDSAAVSLEPQLASHADEMFEVLCDPAVYEHENEPPQSLEWLRQRFARLESRRSPDGREQWLNWVIRLPSSELIGYVQATVHADGRAAIAYVLGSRYWGRGLARQAVEAMISELERSHEVRTLSAVLKRSNTRSLRLLERLDFAPASASLYKPLEVEPDELLMVRDLRAR